MSRRDAPRIEVRVPAGLVPAAIRTLRFPALISVRQQLPDASIADPRAAVRTALVERFARAGAPNLRGASVALALGSRGLGRYPELVAGALDALSELGAEPFVMPAMGSHGGGTPEGQERLLRDYGLVPDGVPLRTGDATVEVDRLDDGTPVHASAVAMSADHVIVLNRVKSHTGFRGPVESGPSKMLVLGLGKRAGATALHAKGYAGFAERLVSARDRLLRAYPDSTAIAVVETAAGLPAVIEALPGSALAAREPELLIVAKERMARLPFGKLDLLVVERAGKDVSGLGMDPNVTGRHPSGHCEAPDPTRIALLGLTEASEGNANGMGHADVIPLGFANAIDPLATWTNAITSTSLTSARMPVVTPDAASCVRLALATCGVPAEAARIAWIGDTGDLTTFRASAAALAEAEASGARLEHLGPPEPPPLEGS